MRTTISIDDEILEQLKRRARETGTSVSEQIEEAIRRDLNARADPAEPVGLELVTFGRGGRFSRFDVDRTSSLLEIEDRERFGSGRP